MNYLIARVNDRKENYRKVISEDSIFYKLPDDLESCHEYSPSYKLEDDEWYSVSELSKKEFCIDILKAAFDSTPYKLLTKADPLNVAYLCAFQGETEVHFQRVFKHNILERKKVVVLGDEISIKETQKQIVLLEIADAIYIKSKDVLYFKKLETIAPIFPGIESLYRVATDGEVEKFIKQDFIKIEGKYGTEKVGKANRQRLAMAIETFNKLKPKQKSIIFNYTNEYYPQLRYDGHAFTVSNEDDMKYFLYGLEQRYYTTPATNEMRVANSVSSIPKG
ncbi:MAG: hypothetical protein EOM50_10950 [Erysipelotrichia bacterium]|nr:hypothetical protein [Erysipelotrichia bacterium]